MKNLPNLLFLSLSLTISYLTYSMEEKPAEEKQATELESLTTIVSKKLADKALKKYTDSYEKNRDYNQAYQVFTNSLKRIPDEILFEKIYCYLINDLDRGNIFVQELLKEYASSNDHETALQFYSKLCPKAQSTIITIIVKEVGRAYHDPSYPSDIELENLALYLTENVHDKQTISSLEGDLKFLTNELSSNRIVFSSMQGNDEFKEEILKNINFQENLINRLLALLDKTHVVLLDEKLVQFPEEIKQKGMELLELYKANNRLEWESAIKPLSNYTKNEILKFYLENYLVSNNNFEDIINAKTKNNPEIEFGNIVTELIYYLSLQPNGLKLETDETSPTFANEVKVAKESYSNLFKQLSADYPKTAEAFYADIYHFYSSSEVMLKDAISLSLITIIFVYYIYWLGLEFNAYVKDKEIKSALNLIIEFYTTVNDIRPLKYLLEELLVLYILPLDTDQITVNHISIFIEILKEIKSREVFDPSIYNEIINDMADYIYNVYSDKDLKPKGLTKTTLLNLVKTLIT